ncbi:MAG TPA: hemolysin III family protein [Candidatus Hydrogenedens sp.]|nr:hemolysin III family protein [Candidatus Hydrogenedens sp.]HOL20468.1 hemolysin III family protein [Candidatus Hydrogenedens sp.]HPP57683.1 hemolysin III family protein [Candidatus Hydrogenedens sp.]
MKKVYTTVEEVFHALTHGLGAGLSVAGLIIMLVLAVQKGDPWILASVLVYGNALILLYLSSTLYHSFPQGKLKQFFQFMDHACIYVLIAGTYTPFLLVFMRGIWGWTLFTALWVLTILGFIFKIFFIGKWNRLATVIYVLMGWIAIIALKPAIEMIPFGALILMLIGGILYTGGVAFYLWERLPFHHVIWHLFVLSASIIHFICVYIYILSSNVS